MLDYIAIAAPAEGELFILAGDGDMTTIRTKAEQYVAANTGASVTIFAKGQTVSIVCAPKWQ